MADCAYDMNMKPTLEIDREEDGLWVCEVPEHPGAVAYGDTRDSAICAAKDLLAEIVSASAQKHGFWDGFLDAFDAFGVRAAARPAVRPSSITLDRAWRDIGSALSESIVRFRREAAVK